MTTYKSFHIIRRTNTLDVMKHRQLKISELAKMLNKEYSYVHNILSDNPTRAIGDRVAREIEVALGLEPNYLDNTHGDPLQYRVELNEGSFNWCENDCMYSDHARDIPPGFVLVYDDDEVEGGDMLYDLASDTIFTYHYKRENKAFGVDLKGNELVIKEPTTLYHVRALLPINR